MDKNKSKNFYVFTGIDGTLNYSQYLRENFSERRVCPESIEALNYLLRTLKEAGYNPHLVCTSGLRNRYGLMCHMLYESGLDEQDHIGATKWVSGDRGEKIIDYLKSHETKFVASKSNSDSIMAKMLGIKPFQNYVVIDRDRCALSAYIPDDKFIRMISYKDYLTMDKVTNFLATQGLCEEESENI